MSLWTCIACTARHAVGLLTCPHCGAAAHEDGDTISPAEGVQGAPHVPEAYPQPIDAAPAPVAALANAGYTPQDVIAAVAPAPVADTPPEPPAATP